MRVSVSVGGHASRWRFPETTKLEQWLDGDGWTSLGGVKTIRIPNQQYFERFSEAIKQSIIGGLSERHDARIDRFAFAGTSTSELTISQAILERMNLNMMQSEYASLCEAGQLHVKALKNKPKPFRAICYPSRIVYVCQRSNLYGKCLAAISLAPDGEIRKKFLVQCRCEFGWSLH